MAAGSAIATARNMTRRDGCALGRRRAILTFRLMNSCPIPASRSAEEHSMAGPSIYEPKSGFERWLDARLPIIRFTQEHILSYPTPKNLNIWYTFGGILTFYLGVQ